MMIGWSQRIIRFIKTLIMTGFGIHLIEISYFVNNDKFKDATDRDSLAFGETGSLPARLCRSGGRSE